MRIIHYYFKNRIPDAEADFRYTEALRFIIETNNVLFAPWAILQLGGWYYERRNFDLALKYYEMAAADRDRDAYACLGYIWYYGRTGERDFEKAFKYFSLAADAGKYRATYAGDYKAAYKIADMYKNGYYVEKDEEKYKSLIEELYLKVKDLTDLHDPVPQVCMRLARIRTEEGKPEEAVRLYRNAKDFLLRRLLIYPFFWDLNNMKLLTEELYGLVEFDKDNFDLYDLYYLLDRPCVIRFEYKGDEYSVECVAENGGTAVFFNGRWFRTKDDFFEKAGIGQRLLTALYYDLDSFEVK